MKKLYLPPVFAIILSLIGISIGDSKFLVNTIEEFNSEAGTVSTGSPVCHNLSTGVYYTTIEAGLTNASSGQTVNVIPGTNPTITSNCTIKEGVTLRLPYDESASDSMTASVMKSGTIYKPLDSGCKLNVTIAEGVTLTNYGTLQISGVLSGGSGGQIACGHTLDSWATLSLGKNAKLVQVKSGSSSSEPVTYCYGYIHELASDNGSLCTFINGKVYAPFVIRDFRGGNITYGMVQSKSSKCFPFNQYEMRNIEPKSRYYGSAELWGMANLYCGSESFSKYNAVQMQVTGGSGDSDVFMMLSSNSAYMEAKYDVSTEICALDFYGGMTTNVMKLDLEALPLVGNISLSSSDYIFPISYRYKITFNGLNGGKATYTANQYYKFLPGSSLTVGKDVIFNCNEVVFYDNFNNLTFSGGTAYPTDKKSAYLLNNGTVSANTLSGYVIAKNTDTTLNVNSSASCSTAEYQSVNTVASIATSANYYTVSNSLTIDKFEDLDVKSKTEYGYTGTYTSTIDLDGDSIGYGTTTGAMSISGSDSIALDGAAATYTLSTGNLIGNSVTWSSSDTSVATVSGNGLNASVTPVSEGTTTLTATVYNGSSVVQSVTKTIEIKGNSINVVIKDTAGNTIYSTSTENSLSYKANLSDYVVYSGSCTNSYGDNLPDYKVLQTITNWTVTNETQKTTSTSSTTSLTVNGKSGDTITIKANGSQAIYNLVYMTAYSYASPYCRGSVTGTDIDGKDFTLNSVGSYCYANTITLKAKGYTKKTPWGTTYTQTTSVSDITDGSISSAGDEAKKTVTLTGAKYYTVSTGYAKS